MQHSSLKLLGLLTLLLTLPTQAQFGAPADLVKATLLADAESVAPGGSFTLGVRLSMKAHWHTYWVNPGETGDPTSVKLSGPPGFEFGPVQWPVPSKIDAPGGISYGYEDEVLLMVPVTVAKDVRPGGASAAIEAAVSWLVCKEECIKGSAKLKLFISVEEKGKPDNAELFGQWRQRIPVAKEAAADMVAGIEQKVVEGLPVASLQVKWKVAPKSVEWFPISTPTESINDVAVKHGGLDTSIVFKPTVYKATEQTRRVGGVLVYEDAKGVRRGINAPVTVPTLGNSQ